MALFGKKKEKKAGNIPMPPVPPMQGSVQVPSANAVAQNSSLNDIKQQVSATPTQNAPQPPVAQPPIAQPPMSEGVQHSSSEQGMNQNAQKNTDSGDLLINDDQLFDFSELGDQGPSENEGEVNKSGLEDSWDESKNNEGENTDSNGNDKFEDDFVNNSHSGKSSKANATNGISDEDLDLSFINKKKIKAAEENYFVTTKQFKMLLGIVEDVKSRIKESTDTHLRLLDIKSEEDIEYENLRKDFQFVEEKLYEVDALIFDK